MRVWTVEPETEHTALVVVAFEAGYAHIRVPIDLSRFIVDACNAAERDAEADCIDEVFATSVARWHKSPLTNVDKIGEKP